MDQHQTIPAHPEISLPLCGTKQKKKSTFNPFFGLHHTSKTEHSVQHKGTEWHNNSNRNLKLKNPIIDLKTRNIELRTSGACATIETHLIAALAGGQADVSGEKTHKKQPHTPIVLCKRGWGHNMTAAMLD